MSKEIIIGIGAVVALALVLYLIAQTSITKFFVALAAVVMLLGWGFIFAAIRQLKEEQSKN
jgi:hypothetical protein